MATDLFPLNPLTPKFLYKVLNERPDDSKRGWRQKYLQPKLAPFENFYEREVLLEKTQAESNLAGLYAPDGQAIPVGDPLFSTMMLSMQDVKSARNIKPNIVQKIREAGELAVFNAGNTSVSKRNKRAIAKEIQRKMSLCEDDVDVTLEYFTVHALLGSLVWPPVNDDGSAVSNPPAFWNAEYSGTWTFPMPSDMNQDVASLVNYAGSAATADQRKYWSDSSADILGQFRLMRQIGSEKYGIDFWGGTVIVPQSTFDLMAENDNIKEYILGSNKEQTGARNFVTDVDVKDYIKTKLGWNFMTYDAFWTYRTESLGSAATKTRVHFLPRNKIIILPPGDIGLRMGTAPIEQADESWKPGKMPWTFKDPKPNYNREVGVNVIAWPVFTNGDDADEGANRMVLQVLA